MFYSTATYANWVTYITDKPYAVYKGVFGGRSVKYKREGFKEEEFGKHCKGETTDIIVDKTILK